MLSFFPLDALNEMWDLIGSVSDDFPTYSFSIYVWEIAVHLAVAGYVFKAVLFCADLFRTRNVLMKSGTELSQFLRIVLPTLSN